MLKYILKSLYYKQRLLKKDKALNYSRKAEIGTAYCQACNIFQYIVRHI